MSTMARLLPPERRALVADALLLTTATGAGVLGLVTLAEEELGDSGWYPPVSTALMLGVVLICPLVVWRLQGRRSSRMSTLGAAAGILAGGAVLWILLMAVALVSLAVSAVSGGAVSEGLAAFLVVAALLAALLVALDVDAVRDLARGHAHVGTDLARLVATTFAVATAAGALWYAAANPGQEPAELLAFGLAGGVIGAVVALGADLMSGTRPATAHD